jgi:hypothetical protein
VLFISAPAGKIEEVDRRDPVKQSTAKPASASRSDLRLQTQFIAAGNPGLG